VADADLPALVAGAALLALPSFLEGFGLPVLEAQACGTPVVCSDRGGLLEAAGDAAVIVDPERPDDIGRGLLSVLCDPRLAQDLGQRGLARAASFTWDAAAELTLGVYRRVLGEPA
jgi:glycosyltransferase involved in cell wall biosynthesis